MQVCVIDGCGGKAIKRQMCNRHYRAWYRSQPGNRDAERQKEKERNRQNPEKRRESARRFYHNNKEAQAERHAAYMRSRRGRFVTARINAKAVGHAWGIDYQQYCALIDAPCAYCGGCLHETGSALDRLDNSRGYETGNVVTCCSSCNMLRGNRLTPNETRVLALVLRAMREGERIDKYLDLTGTGVTWVHTTTAP